MAAPSVRLASSWIAYDPKSAVGILEAFTRDHPDFGRAAGFFRRLRVGEARVDLLLTRHERGDIAVTVVRREGSVEVVVK